MHTRHPTEQTVTDEKLEKNYFRHRYVFISLTVFSYFYVSKNLYAVLHFYFIDYNVQIRKVLAVESEQRHSD